MDKYPGLVPPTHLNHYCAMCYRYMDLHSIMAGHKVMDYARSEMQKRLAKPLERGPKLLN